MVQQLNTRLKETPHILWGFCRCNKADISILKVSYICGLFVLVFCTSESHAVQNAPWANRTHVSFGNGNKWGGRILSSSAVNVILTAEKLVQTCWLDFGSKKKEAFKCGYILVGPQLSRVSLLSRLKKTNRGVEEICLQVWLWRRRLVCLWQTAFWAGATLKEHPAFVVWWYALMWLCMYVCVCACVRTCECWILLSHLLLRLSSCFGSKSVPGDNSA